MTPNKRIRVDNRRVNVVNVSDMAAKKDTVIGITPPEWAHEEVLRLAEREDRAKAYIALQLMFRGMAQYLRDGLIREPDLESLKEKVVSGGYKGRRKAS